MTDYLGKQPKKSVAQSKTLNITLLASYCIAYVKNLHTNFSNAVGYIK